MNSLTLVPSRSLGTASALLALLLASCANSTSPPGGEQTIDAAVGGDDLSDAGQPDSAVSAEVKQPELMTQTCAPVAASFFPVRGAHETGYQSSPSSGDTSVWSCDKLHSNSDFWTGDCGASGDDDKYGHYGLDIWAALDTPVVAAVAGTVVESRLDEQSGNIVTIQDACGFWHFNIHMNSRAVNQGDVVIAGQLIGTVGATGKLSGNVVHLHYSVYPGSGMFCQGVDPHPLLAPVESGVCYVPEVCGGDVCGADQFCSGTRCCTNGECVPGCPC